MMNTENEDKLPPGVYENRLGCADYNRQQTQVEIGFVPFTDLKLYTGPARIGILFLI